METLVKNRLRFFLSLYLLYYTFYFFCNSCRGFYSYLPSKQSYFFLLVESLFFFFETSQTLSGLIKTIPKFLVL